jgi:hypothetical protein
MILLYSSLNRRRHKRVLPLPLPRFRKRRLVARRLAVSDPLPPPVVGSAILARSIELPAARIYRGKRWQQLLLRLRAVLGG